MKKSTVIAIKTQIDDEAISSLKCSAYCCFKHTDNTKKDAFIIIIIQQDLKSITTTNSCTIDISLLRNERLSHLVGL